MAVSELTTASVLAFERKLDPSDALFSGGRWVDRANGNSWLPVAVREKSVRGTISHRLLAKDQDAAKLDAAIENPNLQTVDVATLPSNADTLRVSFTLRVLSGTGTPSACNNAEYRARLLDVVQGYVKEHNFTGLAHRYATNLANGRFLWRNRIGAEQVEVHVAHLVNGAPDQHWVFNALDLKLRDFTAPASVAPDLGTLAGVIGEGLAGSRHVLLSVSAFVRLGEGQEVFPSQELILDKGKSQKSQKSQKGQKSKTLYSVGGVAGMHSQKLGNALRTIDTWHAEAAELGPIAVEPYGSVTTLGKACRPPKLKQDFYSLLYGWLIKNQVLEPDQKHFVIATLVRGGVFGDSGKA